VLGSELQRGGKMFEWAGEGGMGGVEEGSEREERREVNY